jgi:chromosome segregation ATPase
MRDVSGGSHAQKLRDLDEAKAAAERVKTAEHDHRKEFQSIDESLRNAASAFNKAKAPIDAKKQEINDCEKGIQSLITNRGKQLPGFDKNMEKLIKAIKNEPGFHEQPVGPVGLHIRLLKPVWSDVLERSIGQFLSGFIVTNRHDQSLLSTLTKRLNVYVTTETSSWV